MGLKKPRYKKKIAKSTFLKDGIKEMKKEYNGQFSAFAMREEPSEDCNGEIAVNEDTIKSQDIKEVEVVKKESKKRKLESNEEVTLEENAEGEAKISNKRKRRRGKKKSEKSKKMKVSHKENPAFQVSGKNYSCLQCDKSVATLSSMSHHYRDKHRNNLLPTDVAATYFRADTWEEQNCTFCKYKETKRERQAFHLFTDHTKELIQEKKNADVDTSPKGKEAPTITASLNKKDSAGLQDEFQESFKRKKKKRMEAAAVTQKIETNPEVIRNSLFTDKIQKIQSWSPLNNQEKAGEPAGEFKEAMEDD